MLHQHKQDQFQPSPRKLNLFPVAAIVLALFASTVRAETLPLPQNLVGAATDAGEALLVGAEAREAYFPLANNFLTQKNQAFCGVASIVMVLNAMQLQAPAVPEFDPYTTFTQDNILDTKTEAVLPVTTIMKQGMTLDQIGGILTTKDVKAEVHHAAESNIESFRESARSHLATPDQFVIVNYLRKAINQEKGGHISPLAAYDQDTDRFLILDVARYKYPPVWVTAGDLFSAMNTQDSDNENKTRGFVLVSKKP